MVHEVHRLYLRFISSTESPILEAKPKSSNISSQSKPKSFLEEIQVHFICWNRYVMYDFQHSIVTVLFRGYIYVLYHLFVVGSTYIFIF